MPTSEHPEAHYCATGCSCEGSAKHLARPGRLEGVPDVLDHGCPAIVGPDDGHDIEPRRPVQEPVPPEEVEGGQGEPALFFRRDRLGRVAPPSCLDLDEDDGVPVAGDQVDLALRGPVVTDDRPDPRAPKVARRRPLAAVAEPSAQEGSQGFRPGGTGGALTGR